jgi:hypothetical protein
MGDEMSGKIKLTFDVLKWIVIAAFMAGGVWASIKFESKDHSDSTYVKKELYQNEIEHNREDHDRMFKQLDRIENKIDKNKK